jgi:outer membrane receptor protein involved in Fe transport
MRDSIRFTLSAAVSAVALAGSAVPAFAQSASEIRAQDIIVTARKRAESLQDAPVAISVVSAQKLNQNALTSLTDVAGIAGGGVMIAQAGVTTTLSIRGISSDSTNIGFDQTVGIVIDGVFYDKARWVNQGFMDMSQVEILKGPQALYFGRSAVAGAINITTAGPTDKFEAAATVGYETEGREIYTEGFVSGPITDTLGGRIAVRLSDSEGPWNNKALSLPDKRFGATNDKSARPRRGESIRRHRHSRQCRHRAVSNAGRLQTQQERRCKQVAGGRRHPRSVFASGKPLRLSEDGLQGGQLHSHVRYRLEPV